MKKEYNGIEVVIEKLLYNDFIMTSAENFFDDDMGGIGELDGDE